MNAATLDPIYFTRHAGGVSMIYKGKPAVVSSAHAHFPQILEALRQRKWAKVMELISVAKTITRHGKSRKLRGARIFVKNGKVFYTYDKANDKATELHGTLVERILNDLGKKNFHKYADALMLFLDNVRKNEIKDIREELYEWLSSGKTPLTMDGCFLAYKKVRSDFLDGHTGTIDNSPGERVWMRQKDVDANRNKECSTGLHFCSRGYLNEYGAGSASRIVVVKVNPRHVFAIPRDYNFQKGRASEYFVVGEYKGARNDQDGPVGDIFKDSFIDEDNKAQAMPDVKIEGWLTPSLEKHAASYGLVKDGKVFIVERRGRLIPVKQDERGDFIDIMGTPMNMTGVGEDVVQTMSIKTKSVREALKAAINKIEGKIGS